MFTPRKLISCTLMVAFAITSLGAGLSVSAQQRAFRVRPQEVDLLLRRIETRSTQFRQSLPSALNQSRVDGTRQEDNINELVRNFELSTSTLRERFRQRQDVASDVREVLNRAAFIDRFMSRQRLAQNVEQTWTQLRTDLDTLSQYYDVTWNWDAGSAGPGNEGPGRGDGRTGGRRVLEQLTGTFTIDPARSDRVGRTARIATRGASPEEQQRLRDMISRRLEAPEMLAIQRERRTITIASTRGPQFTFEADGRPRTEQTDRGRTMQVTSNLVGDQLSVTSTGNRGNDFTVTFEPVAGGRELRVTRRMEVEGLTQPVVATSYYNKTSDVAQLDLYRESAPVRDGRGDGRGGSSLPDTQIVAILDNGINTRQAREGDRFTMTVRSPSQIDGAVIEGHLGRVDRSGRISGRTQLALNFDRIRLRNGSTRPFDGYIESIRTLNGDDVRVDNEGRVSEQTSQTTTTVTRTGVGAALGALIGAIAGGGKGAAIGAGVGAGAGAGSVYIQGRDDIEMVRGSEFTIRANSADYQAERRN